MPVTANGYDRYQEFIQAGLFNTSDTFKVELHNALTFTSTHEQRSEIAASALATGNGYTNPGQNLGTVTWSTAAGVQTFDSADPLWTATGGSIGPATDAVYYYDAPGGNPDYLLIDLDFDGAFTATAGTDFKITHATTGIYQVAK